MPETEENIWREDPPNASVAAQHEEEHVIPLHEETTDELLTNAEQKKLLALEKGLRTFDLLLRELNIPYKVVGSTALALHATKRGEALLQIPDDIDIALKTHNDLLRFLRYVDDVKPQNITREEPRRIGQGALIAKGTLHVENTPIPFELMAHSEIVPKEAWNAQKTISGISVLTGEELKKQYGNIAKIEEKVARHARGILHNLTKGLSSDNPHLPRKIAERLVHLLPSEDRDLRTQLGVEILHFIQSGNPQPAQELIIKRLLNTKAKNRSKATDTLASA